MYVVVVLCQVHEEHVAAFAEASLDNARHSVLDEPGCQRFDVVQETEDPTRIWLYEIYDDRAAFEQHLTMPHYHRWRGNVGDWFRVPAQVSFANSLILSEEAR